MKINYFFLARSVVTRFIGVYFSEAKDLIHPNI